MEWTLDLVPDLLLWGAASLAVAQVAQVVGLTLWYLAFPALWLLTGGAWLLRASVKVGARGRGVCVWGGVMYRHGDLNSHTHTHTQNPSLTHIHDQTHTMTLCTHITD